MHVAEIDIPMDELDEPAMPLLARDSTAFRNGDFQERWLSGAVAQSARNSFADVGRQLHINRGLDMAKEQRAHKLSQEQKVFVVELLASYRMPSEVVREVKERFGIDISPQAVEAYDPTKRAGKRLSKELRALFESARAEYVARVSNVAVTQLVVRMEILQKGVLEFVRKGNYLGAAQLLEQVARDVGGMYTNRRELSGCGGAIVAEQRHSFSIEDTQGMTPQELDIAERLMLNMLARVDVDIDGSQSVSRTRYGAQ